MPYTPNTTWVDGSGGGTPLSAARLNNMEAGIWPVVQTYTPSWTSTGSAPSVGNGTLAGSYIQIGKLVIASFALTCGGTTGYGTGNYSFSLPVAALSGREMSGQGIAQNTGGANASNIIWRASGDVILAQLAFAQMSPTSPITLASGSTVNATIVYLAA